jgi:predicted O-methyltransferase YrrM
LRYAVLSLPFQLDTSRSYGIKRIPLLKHSVFAWLGLRPALAQHTAAEHVAFKRWANNCKILVEIGVAEGVSALALREGMAEDGVLHLIDPFHLSRYSTLNFSKRTARRTVETHRRGKVVWIEKFSQDAVQTWQKPIDLLLIDGDHTETGVERDWNDWGRFVKPGGIAIFHDARLFEGGWTTPDYGPVKLVNRLFRDGSNPDWSIAEETHSLFVVRRNS